MRGGVLPIGSGDDPDFTPVELLLAALAGCTAIDVGLITGKRAQPDDFDIHVEGHKVRDDGGSHLVDLSVTVSIRFPEGEGGDAARAVLPARDPADRRPAVHGRPHPPARYVDRVRRGAEPPSYDVGQPVVTFVIVTFSFGCPSPGPIGVVGALGGDLLDASHAGRARCARTPCSPGAGPGVLVDDEELRASGVRRWPVLAIASVPGP